MIVVNNFEANLGWRAVTRQSTNVKSGTFARLWDNHPTNLDVQKSFSPALSASNAHNFQFWLHSAIANRANLSLVLYSDSASTGQQDYYIYDFSIDWVGWHFFNLSIDEFRADGTPVGWNKIDRIRFNTSGWGNSPKADTALILDDIQFAPQVIEAIYSDIGTVNNAPVWQHQIVLRNSTNSEQQFDLATVVDASQQISAQLSQTSVMVEAGQSKQIGLAVTVPQSAQNHLELQEVDLAVSINNQRVDSLRIATYPPLPEHPRLYVQAQDIAALKARYNHPDLANVKAELLAQVQQKDQGSASSPRADTEIRRSIEARAFLYLINGDANRGQEAVNMMLRYLDSVQQQFDSINSARDLYDSIVAAAMVYDWCYDLLTADQQQQIISNIEKLASFSEFGWPISEKITYITGHYSEHAAVALLAAGIATFDEDPHMFNTVHRHFVEGLAPSRNAYYAMGKHHQGTSYAVSRFFHEAHSALLFDGIGYDGVYSDEQHKVPYHMIYARTPSKWFLTEGDVFDPTHIDPRNQLIMAQIFDDPYLMNDGLRVSDNGNYWTLQDAARTFLFWDPTVTQQPLDELPTARYFPSPSGSMIARTGWEMDGGKESNVAMAMMNIGEYYFGNHAHLDSGHFGLYYKGTLAVDSGVYEGNNGGYNSRHFRNYYQRTIAHNTLLLEDPNEPIMQHYGYSVETRDGGQYRRNNGNEWDSIQEMFDQGKHAEVLAHEIGAGRRPDYTYLKGDIAAGYNPPAEYNYPAKADEMKRSFVFLDLKDNNHPAALIVFDRVTATQNSFKKKWLLHSTNEPQISGSRISFTRTDSGNNGRLVNDVLLPAANNQQIEKIGGQNYEFWVDDRNIYNNPNHWAVEPGAWRIELSPNNAARTDTFLNVMHVMDANGGPQPLDATRLDADKMVGAQIADRAVFFSKDAAPIGEGFSVSTNGSAANLHVLITDVQPGTWTVQTPGGLQTVTATNEGKSLYFSAPAGTYQIVRGQNQPPATPNQTSTPTATPTPIPAMTEQPTTPAATPAPTRTPWPTVALPTPTPRPTNVPNADASFHESFDGIYGIVDGVNGWKTYNAYVETIPNADVQQALSIAGQSATAYRALPTGIEQGKQGILHFRIKRTGDADIFVGLSDLAEPTDFNAFEVQFGSQFGEYSESSPNSFAARSGANARNLTGQFVPNQWHCVWLVIDNAADEYEAFVLGGAYDKMTQLHANGQKSFNFRNSTGDRLQTFYARTGWESAKVYIDDIYMTPDQTDISSQTPSCQVQPIVDLTLTPTSTPTNTPGATPRPTTEPNKTPTPTATLTATSQPQPTVQPTATPTPADPNKPADGTISGQVFVDANNNGQYDEGEQVFPSMYVILIDSSTEGQTLTITTSTDENGIYRFANVPSSDYIISYSAPPGYSTNNSGGFLIETGGSDTPGPDIGLIGQGPPIDTGNLRYFLPLATK